MKLNDGRPWFRKWASIGYRPITPEGWLLLLLGFGLFLVLTLLWLQLPVDSAWEEVCGWAAFLVAITTNAIAYLKVEDQF